MGGRKSENVRDARHCGKSRETTCEIIVIVNKLATGARGHVRHREAQVVMRVPQVGKRGQSDSIQRIYDHACTKRRFDHFLLFLLERQCKKSGRSQHKNSAAGHVTEIAYRVDHRVKRVRRTSLRITY